MNPTQMGRQGAEPGLDEANVIYTTMQILKKFTGYVPKGLLPVVFAGAWAGACVLGRFTPDTKWDQDAIRGIGIAAVEIAIKKEGDVRRWRVLLEIRRGTVLHITLLVYETEDKSAIVFEAEAHGLTDSFTSGEEMLDHGDLANRMTGVIDGTYRPPEHPLATI